MEKHKDEVGYGTMASWHVSGPGPSVVCVHGAGVSSRQTFPLLKACSGRMSAWAVDLPGFGASTAVDERPNIDKLVDALLEWLQRKELSRPCLLGVSFGTQIVAEAAAREPDAVGSVVLAGPTVDPYARSMPLLAARLIWNNFYEGLSVISSSAADYRATGMRRVFRSWDESRRHRLDRTLPEVKQPSLVLRGGKDVVCPQPWVEEVTRLLPRGRLVVVPGKPHALTSASPERVAGLVHDFVSKEGAR